MVKNNLKHHKRLHKVPHIICYLKHTFTSCNLSYLSVCRKWIFAAVTHLIHYTVDFVPVILMLLPGLIGGSSGLGLFLFKKGIHLGSVILCRAPCNLNILFYSLKFRGASYLFCFIVGHISSLACSGLVCMQNSVFLQNTQVFVCITQF